MSTDKFIEGIPRRPWVYSTQYEMPFVLSQDNEIILGTETCKRLGERVCRFIVNAVNRETFD